MSIIHQQLPPVRAQERWGVECLVLETQRRDQWQRTVAEKAKQLADPATNRSFIAVDASNLIDHQPFRRGLNDRTGSAPRQEMEDVLDEELGKIVSAIDVDAFWKRIARHQLGGILIHADTVTASDGHLVHVGLGRIVLRGSSAAVKDVAGRLLMGFGA